MHTHTHTHTLTKPAHTQQNMQITVEKEVDFYHFTVCTLSKLAHTNYCTLKHDSLHTSQLPAWITKRFNMPRRQFLPLSSLFNMQGINCLHDKLEPSQQHPCDIYTRVVYKHRCGNIISGFVGRMSRESSPLFALMNHATPSFRWDQPHIWHMCWMSVSACIMFDYGDVTLAAYLHTKHEAQDSLFRLYIKACQIFKWWSPVFLLATSLALSCHYCPVSALHVTAIK